MYKSLLQKTLLVALLVTGFTSASKAQLITFDTLTNLEFIPNAYAGLNWNNFVAIDQSYHPGSGYDHGVISPHQAAFNAFGDAASLSSISAFNFTSLYLTSAWNTGLTVRIDGRLNGTLLYTRSFVVNTNAPTFELLNYVGVNEVDFASFGGVNAGLGGNGTHFAIDNVQLNGASAVPEPSTYGLIGAAGLLGMVALRRRVLKK